MYKVGDDFPLTIVSKKDSMEILDTEEEHLCTIIKLTKDSIVVEDDEGRYITLGATPKAH